jgi:hypothetical protein
MRFIVTVICMAIAAVMAAVASGAAASTPITGRHFTKITTPTALAGTWRLCVCGDGSYEITRQTATETVSTAEFRGSWKKAGSKLTFNDWTGCTAAGVYTWQLAGRQLTFHVVRDACTRRKLVLASRWTTF